MEKRIVIVGGGFGGVKAALDLGRMRLPRTKIMLISDKPHFEYHALLYRVLTGRSPLEVCIPLRDIFTNTDVEVVEDSVTHVSIAEQTCFGASGSVYRFDYVVLGLGSVPSYFNTPGLQDLSYSINTITSTLKLKRHLHEIFLQCEAASAEDKTCGTHIVVVGGGATGVETAAELAVYARALAKKHGVDPSFVTIDLIHSGSRLMSLLSEEESELIRLRLYTLGVNIFLNRRVMKEELEQVYLKDMEMKTKTLIWSAGVSPHPMYAHTEGLTVDERGRVPVDEYLRAKNISNVYIVGDGAVSPYGGMAQTAVRDGTYAASHIAASMRGESIAPYVPKKPSYVIPVGPSWAIGKLGNMIVHGDAGWLLRRYHDLKFFLTILPWEKAWLAFKSDGVLWESCPICSKV